MTNGSFRSRDISILTGKARFCLVCFLALLLPASQLAAQSDGPMLYPKGNVTVDGKAADRPIALFAGEKVQTAAAASASLTALGSTVLLSPDTSLTYGENAFQMGCGEVLVTTVVKRLSARVANLTIIPNSDVVKYQISRANGKLQIATREGSINVNDGVQTTSLDTGKVISFSAGNDCPLDASAPGQTSAPPAKSVSISKGKIAAIVLGVAAAGGAGIALALSRSGGSKTPVSPSVP